MRKWWISITWIGSSLRRNLNPLRTKLNARILDRMILVILHIAVCFSFIWKYDYDSGTSIFANPSFLTAKKTTSMKISIIQLISFSSCWPINRWKSSDFQAVWICEAKILTKKDTMLIFFQWRLKCYFLQFWCRMDIRVDTGRLFYFEILRFRDFNKIDS